MAVTSLQEIRKTINSICQDDRINRIVLFGSYARGSEDDHSDIDLFIDSDRQITGFDYFELKACFEDALGCEIDLVSDVDLIPYSRIENEIRTTGVTVYER
ncbi:MAG: nucleotidyltransferase domain-containing protein [Vallitaleaceae bacterium]|nr:nucleotidyltransferase domain-containing protein [Vallitaleaceae bacterium]